MRPSRAFVVGLASLAALPACAAGSGSSGSGSNTSVAATSSAAKPAASPSPAARSPSPSPTPSPSPSPFLNGSVHLDPTKAAHWLFSSSGGNGTNGGVITFAVDPSTGVLTAANDTPVPPNFGAFCLAADPTGTILFVSGVGGSGAAGWLMPMAISSGALTAGTPVATTTLVPFALAVDPASQNVFTAESTTVSAFSYAAGAGTLAAETPLQSPTGTQWTRGLCIDATGSTLYYAPHPGAGIEVVPLASGAFAASAPTTIALNPAHDVSSLALAPSGNVLYVGTPDDVVCVLTRTSTGWTQVDVHAHEPAITSQSVTITALALDASGQFLATSHGGPNSYPGTDDASLFRVDATGALTLVVATPAHVGSAPNNVIWNPGGNVFYVADTWTNSIAAYVALPSGVIELPGSPFVLPNGEQLPTGLAVTR